VTRRNARYGWRPDLPDHLDRKYTLRLPGVARPTSVDLRPKCPPVYDQGDLGSCTANAIAGALEFDQMRQSLAVFTPSRLFIYYNERVIEGTVGTDAGAELRDGIKSIASQGAPPETVWPYDVSQFATKPPDAAYTDALGDVALKYERIDNTVLDQLKDSLAAGFPFALGFTVYESFESDAVAQTGVVPMPGPNEGVVGGHAVDGVGYDEGSRIIICRNSWNTTWGQAGYFTLPYDYVTNSDLASDFWNVEIVGKAS
jgi:C1A family cysteine protease